MLVSDDEPWITYYCQNCGGNPVTFNALEEPDIYDGYYICPGCRLKMKSWGPSGYDLNGREDADEFYDDYYNY